MRIHTIQGMINTPLSSSAEALLVPVMSGTFRTMDRKAEKEARADRLKEARASAKFSSARQAAERFGWPIETYKAHESGRNGFDNDAGRKYAKAFRVTLAWLMTGEDSDEVERLPFLPEDVPDGPGRDYPGIHGHIGTEGRVGIPENEIPQIDANYGLGYQAPPDVITVEVGAGQTVSAVPLLGTWRIPDQVISRRIRTSFQNLHFVECEGDSMEPRIKDGDVVLVDQSRKNPSMPGIFAIAEPTGLTLKKVEIVRGSVPLRLRLIPENLAYSSYEVDADEVTIIGRYVARFTMD